MSRKSSRRRGKRKALKQLEFQFLDYERSAVLAGFISVRQPGEVYGRRQRALFALPFLGERLTEFASVIDRRKPLIPAVAARLGVSPAAIRYLRNFSASELQALGYPLEEMARAAEAVRLPRASAQLLGEAARRLRLLRQISQAVGIPEAEMVSRAAVLERLPECHPGGDLTAPLATVYQHLFLPELFIVSRIEGRQPTPALVDSLTKRPPPRVWAALGQAFYGQKGPAAILETIASWNAGGGQPLSTPGGEPAMEQLRKIPLWGGLLPKSFSTGALRVRSLTSVPELIEEGLALRHCIARYAIGCAYYDRHVLGITTSAGYRLSTALVQLSPEGEVGLTEHRGYGNSAPDSRTAEALALALAEIRRNLGSAQRRSLAAQRRRRIEEAGGEDAATGRLYPFYAPFLREYMFRAYCAPYLTKQDRELTHREWLMKRGLHDMARELFASLRDGFVRGEYGPIPPASGLWNAMIRSVDQFTARF